ncbi:MAG: PD-(D/E)XK nuclease family protein, partial [Clostridia bacterium]|nr:PD-(D/E)XK nuclease family protein [Clostridia bacterium]
TPYRFRNAALEALEATALTSELFETRPSDAVRVTRCADIYEECGYVAQTVRRLMREDGYRARDIAIVARNLADYTGVLDVALDHAAVPYYLDRRAPIATESIVTALLTALSIAGGNWKTDLLVRLMKTGLLGFSVMSASNFENYIYVWNITGAQFKTDWTQHPRGFRSAMTPRDEAALSQLNRLRRRLVRPLVTLAKALDHPVTGREFAAAAYAYLHHARIDRMTAFQVKRLRASGETALAEHTVAVWDALMTLLDEAATVLGDDRLDPAHATELLRAAAVTTDVGSIPQSLDAVQIGAADRMRFSEPRAVFVLGANEGVFPALPSTSGVLSERERRQLCEAGVPFEDHREQHTASERFLAYAALSAASERVFVSYCDVTPGGDGGEPSSLCHTVLSRLPYLKPCAAYADDGSDVEFAEEAFERMADGFRAGTPLSKALYRLLYDDERFRGRLDTMTRLAKDEPIAFEDGDVAKRFFGDHMILSATRVEEYHKCRFMYFCHYGLNAQPRRRAELDALESGNLMHYVMEHSLPVYVAEGIKTIERERCAADARRLSLAYVQEEMGGLEEKPRRFVKLFETLQSVCERFLWHTVCELSQSHFEPVDYELPISFDSEKDSAVKPMVMTLEDGAQIAMIGKVDRVDMYRDGERTFLRVIDYKTGQKTFSLEDVVEGINLQMLIYMMTLCENGEPRYGKDLLPAGILYVPAKAADVKVGYGSTPEKLALQKLKAMRMKGLVVSDTQVLQAMEPGVKGVFIPAEIKADGTLSTAHSSIASLEQFGKLGRRAKELLGDMAQSLREGDVDACPYTLDPCKYCAYRAVCGHESDDRVREPRFDSSEAVLAALEQKEDA